MADLDFDTSEWMKGFDRLEQAVDQHMSRFLSRLGDELLRLSNREVPHKDGYLQTSADQEFVAPDEILVGYNKAYAAYQHEGSWPNGSHVIKNHTKPGTKTHYLSDPLAQNTQVFEQLLQSELEGVFK